MFNQGFCAAVIMAMSMVAPVSLAQTPADTAPDNSVAKADKPVRDPTQPLGYTTARAVVANTNYTLNSVLISAQRKHAVINGITLREGQTIPGSGGVLVNRISPQTVVLQQGTKTWALRLSPSVVKRH